MAEEDADVDIDIDIDSDGDHPAAHPQSAHPSSLSSPQQHDHATIPHSRIEQRSPSSAPRASADSGSDLRTSSSQLARQGSMEYVETEF